MIRGALMKKNKVGIWGWWQGNNLGDNWIKRTMQELFPNAFFLDTTVSNFKDFDFIICGGGGLFVYDVIEPWNNYKQKVPFGMLGLGAEFEHKSNTAQILKDTAQFFYVRDQYSLEAMHIKDAERSFDITFAKPLRYLEEKELNLDKLYLIWRDGKELLLNEKFCNYIDYAAVKNEWYSIVKKNFDDVRDDDFQTTLDNIDERLEGVGFVISGRYHGIVAAIQKGLPFIAIDICPKIRALVKECNLEEYCVKISEVDKIDALVKKAKNNYRLIRQNEKEYRDNARAVLNNQLLNINFEINKVINPLKILHYGSYWMGKNDVVNVMSDDLQDCCKLKKIDLHAYKKNKSKRIKNINPTPNGMLCILDAKMINKDINKYKPDAVILNSGGLTLEDDEFNELRNRNIITVGIELSDPDVFPYNGEKIASKFDLFYTNSKYSYENQYCKKNVNIHLMPFAASLKHHYFMPEVEKKYDLVVVAHAREDRKNIVKTLENICNVGTYGSGWENSLGIVNGVDHTKAINSGKMYLSFSQTVAGYENVKVGLFEAMACRQVIITRYMNELEDYFEIGKEILCYQTEEELYDIVKYYCNHEDKREEIRECAYLRFQKEHTYEKRWRNVLQDIYDAKRKLN